MYMYTLTHTHIGAGAGAEEKEGEGAEGGAAKEANASPGKMLSPRYVVYVCMHLCVCKLCGMCVCICKRVCVCLTSCLSTREQA
jgi:hypothetical protein